MPRIKLGHPYPSLTDLTTRAGSCPAGWTWTGGTACAGLVWSDESFDGLLGVAEVLLDAFDVLGEVFVAQ